VVLVADPIFGAASIFGDRRPLFHQRARPAQLLGGEVRPATARFPLPLEFIQRLAALLVRAPYAPLPSAWHPAW
jgi:hypothetical protein